MPIERVEHQHRGWLVGDALHLGPDAEPIQDMKDVGSELDAVADRTEIRRAFEHPRSGMPRRASASAVGEPAEPAADESGWIAVT